MGFSFEDFVRESNRIEGINRDPSAAEITAHEKFVKLGLLTIEDVQDFVNVVAPGHKLRDQYGLDVRVGDHIAPRGCPEIRTALQTILTGIGGKDPWQTHIEYETLHPFTDGNGRSGRAIWLWQMTSAPIGFLHNFYYQTLSGVRR